MILLGTTILRQHMFLMYKKNVQQFNVQKENEICTIIIYIIIKMITVYKNDTVGVVLNELISSSMFVTISLR